MKEKNEAEFKLSELVFEKDKGFYKTPHLLLKKDVKEFIRLETYLLGNLERKEISFDEFWRKRKELAGDLK